jgi:hypothetical protein
MTDHDRGAEKRVPKTKFWGGLVIAALAIAILLLATGLVKFGPY